MDCLGRIDAAQDGAHLLNIEILTLLEDQYFRMIVKGKCLFRRLIVDDDWTERWIRFKDLDEIEAESALELSRLRSTITGNNICALRTANQLAVIQCC